jgi:hypothetical protein
MVGHNPDDAGVLHLDMANGADVLIDGGVSLSALLAT